MYSFYSYFYLINNKIAFYLCHSLDHLMSVRLKVSVTSLSPLRQQVRFGKAHKRKTAFVF